MTVVNIYTRYDHLGTKVEHLKSSRVTYYQCKIQQTQKMVTNAHQEQTHLQSHLELCSLVLQYRPHKEHHMR